MAQLLQWTSFLLICVATRVSAIEITSSTWRCVDGTRDNLTSVDCICMSIVSEGYTWTNVDCRGRNFTKFATNTTLPLFIKRLDLSRNNIVTLGESPFQHWNPLKELILSYNGMVSIVDYPFSGLELLTILDLSHNHLTVLPSSLIFDNKRVTSLDLGFNNLSSLPPEVFDENEKLQSLSLNYNSGIGRYLNSGHRALFKAFKNGLSHLELNQVNLSAFPENFFNEAFNLSRLYISENRFQSVPGLFIGSLEVLNLSGADIGSLGPGSFITLPSLKELYLDRMMNLTVVEEGAFDGMNSLRTLSMENCIQLQSFHGLAFGHKVGSLKAFSLAQGGLQVLSSELRMVLKEVDAIELHGNPWHCNCNMAWVLDLNLTSHERKKLRCFSPPHLRGVRLFSLTPDQLVCPRPVSRVRSGLLVAMAVLLGMLSMAAVMGLLSWIRKHWPYPRPRKVGRYQPIEVQLEANRAEYEWEDKETTGLSVTQSSVSP